MPKTIILAFFLLSMNSCQEFQREYVDVDNYKVITNRTVLMKEQIVDLEKSILNDSIHQITDAFHDLYVCYDDLCHGLIALAEIEEAIAQSPTKVNNKIKKQLNSRTLVADFLTNLVLMVSSRLIC